MPSPPVATVREPCRALAERRPCRRVLLAARRHAQRSGRPRLSRRPRTRTPRGAGACEAARGAASTARSSRASSRTTRACRIGNAATGITARYETGREYPIHARKRRDVADAPEQVMLDVNALAERLRLLPGRRAGASVPTTASSPTPRTTSAVASGRSASRISRPASTLPGSRSPNAEAGVGAGPPTTAPCSTSRSIPRRCWATRSGSTCSARDAGADPVVYEQDDTSFYTRLGNDQGRAVRRHPRAQHRRERISLRRRRGSDPHSEGLSAARARSSVRRRPPRRPLDHPDELAGAELPADGGRGRRRSASASAGARSCRTATMRSFTASTCSRDFLAISERSGGLRKIRVHPLEGGEDYLIASDEPAYTAHARPERGARHRARPLHLHVADHARHRPTTTTSAPAPARC